MLHIYAVADAVLALIQGASLSQSVTARRAWSPRSTTRELASGYVVNVVPAGVGNDDTARTRGTVREIFTIEIGIQRKLSGADAETQVDAVVLLADQIKALFVVNCISGSVAAHCLGVDHDPIIDGGHLRDERIATSLLTARFWDGS